MAKTKISEFSATPGNNTDIDGINIAEGCAPSGINDAIRELMSQLKDFQAGTAGDSFNGPVGTTTAAAGAFTTLSASSSVTLSGGTANSIPYLNGSKVLTTGSALQFDGSNLGLGVTPSAWSGYGPVFQMKNGGGLANNTGEDVHVFNNCYYNGSSWRYITSTTASRYEQYLGGHYWMTAPSGTAGNAVSFTQAMTLDASGNLGIGTSSPGSYNSSARQLVLAASGNTGMTIRSSSGVANIVFSNAEDSGVDGLIQYDPSSNFMRFDTNGSERARIDSSGNLLVGDTALTLNSRVYALRNSNGIAFAAKTTTTSDISLYCSYTGTTGTPYFGYWVYNGNVVGSISATASTTSYNTSSDYRLKENIQPMTGALAKVAALKPCTYKWKADGSDGEGFIAHELAEVVPQAVTGEKDAVDADGKPVYQGIDTSFLAGLYAAALQELMAEVNSLKAEIAALKA